MKLLFVFLIAGLASLGQARAGLLGGGCSTAAILDADTIVQYASTAQGGYCRNLLALNDAAGAIRLSLIPLSAAMAVPSVKAALAAEAAAVTAAIAASPAILAVTAVGSVGIVTSYIVVKASIETCKEMNQANLKLQLYEDLEKRYGLKPLKSIPLEIED